MKPRQNVDLMQNKQNEETVIQSLIGNQHMTL